jgi:hypothetical protein
VFASLQVCKVSLVFDREATSQLIDFCLGVRVGFSRFAFSPISTMAASLLGIGRNGFRSALRQRGRFRRHGTMQF